MSSRFSVLLLVTVLILGACGDSATVTPVARDEFVFGLVLVGPKDDHGWSESHYQAGLYLEANLPNARMVYLESLNPDDRPATTLEEAVDGMVAQGAQMIFLTSDEFAADTYLVAGKYPDVTFIHISGDHALKEGAPKNVGNYMGRMIYGKMIAGCAAALITEAGFIGYVGPLINDETRRLANATYLGACYCYQHYRGRDPDQLRFQVEWIGFWFYIPGATADPTEVTHDLFDRGADVILSGLDTTEVLVVAGQRGAEGKQVWAIPYDYQGACAEAPEVCLGVPYFNWGPGYLKLAQQVIAGAWTPRWQWVPPDWDDINDPDTSVVGFVKGPALGAWASEQLDRFVAGLADGSIDPFRGPLRFQDGSLYLAEGEVATDEQIWYMPQLLAGMEGLSE